MSDMTCPTCGNATLPVRGGIAHLTENGKLSFPCPSSEVIPLIERARQAQETHEARIPVQQTIRRTIRTEDGHEVGEGDAVYDYYDMQAGRIVELGDEDRRDVYHDRWMQGSIEPWFTVELEDGTKQLLNGQRVCSMEGARKKGWTK